MKLQVLSEDIAAMDVVETIFSEVLADPAIKGSYSFGKKAAGRILYIAPDGADDTGILGSWAIYSDQPLVFGLSVDAAAMNAYNLPTDILDHSSGQNEYDLRNPEDVERFEDTVRRYVVEFEKRNAR